MDPLVTERRQQSGKNPVLCMLGLLSIIIRGSERADQKSADQGKVALAHEHNLALITSIFARGVAHTSARRISHPARAGFFFRFFYPPPILHGDVEFHKCLEQQEGGGGKGGGGGEGCYHSLGGKRKIGWAQAIYPLRARLQELKTINLLPEKWDDALEDE